MLFPFANIHETILWILLCWFAAQYTYLRVYPRFSLEYDDLDLFPPNKSNEINNIIWIPVKYIHKAFWTNTSAKKLQICQKHFFWSTFSKLNLLFSWFVEFLRGEGFSVIVHFQFLFHAISIGSQRWLQDCQRESKAK